MVKSLFKRILVGVGVALVLSFLRGNLFANVYAAQLGSAGSGTLSSCTSCSRLDYNAGGIFRTWKKGTLTFNFAMYDQTFVQNSYNWSIVPANVYLSANGTDYACSVGAVSNPRHNYNTDEGLNSPILESPMTARYTATCRVEPGSVGITSIHILGLGNSGTAGIQLYGPITMEEDSDSSQQIINGINENNNQNTQQTIESQKVCSSIDKSSIKTFGVYLQSDGNTNSGGDNIGITKYLSISSNDELTLLSNTSTMGGNFCFYNINKQVISCTSQKTSSLGLITIPSDSSYFRATIDSSQNKPTFKLCRNGNQAITDSTNQLNDTLNDDNVSSDTNSTINQFLEPTSEETFGPIADLLLLPLTLLRAFYSGFNGTCTTFNLGSLLGTNLTLPCIDLRSILGNSLYNTIDIAISLFMILNIVLMCIDIFDRLTSLEDPFNELYTPKHTYYPRHGGDN